MYIKKVVIENFKGFKGEFTLELDQRCNILVGDNEAGKSTILEAIHLALTGLIFGRPLQKEFNQALFNDEVVKEYLKSLSEPDAHQSPPEILIELYFETEETSEDSDKATFEGDGNSLKEKACGIKFKINFNDKYQNEYDALIRSETEQKSLPIEYYEFSWSSFARDQRVTPKTIPVKSALIDSASNRYQNGSDIYIAHIIRNFLSDNQVVEISQVHRHLKDAFSKDKAICEINAALEQGKISEKKVKLSIDTSTRSAWERSLTTYLDNIPFSYCGKGEQCLIKTKLALSHKKSQKASLLLLEEPENHLSYSKLHELILYIRENQHKQIIISTHSSFVANKLSLSNLILLNFNQDIPKRKATIMRDLSEETKNYFEKLPGYDTLRLLLCRKAILVEGSSDELIIQKAFLKSKERLPIEDRVDVISVGTAFLRFLEIAQKIKKPVVVVTDNDGDFQNKITKKYQKYTHLPTVKICADKNDKLKTLEPQIIEANKEDLEPLKRALGITESDKLKDYMQNNKADYALKIFKTKEEIKFPTYTLEAVEWEYE